MRKGKQDKNFIVVLKVLMAVCVCVTMVLLLGKFTTKAVFDETKAVPYSTYSASHQIENSVLFIGTYLIHSQALTDELYEKAMESASQSGQANIYYKSELASGTWYDITYASGIEDISGKGIIIDESELANLWVTSYTGSNGITQDAVSNSSVSIFDTPSPYNLYELPELEAIRIQYDNSFSESSKGMDLYYYDVLTEFFALELQTDRTNSYDQSLVGLQSCYVALRNQQKDDLAEIVHKLMGKIDAARRAEVMVRLCQIDNNEIEKLQKKCSSTTYDDVSSNYEREYVENMNVTEAIGTALESCQESYISYSSNALSEGSTILTKKEYALSSQIISYANNGYNAEQEARILRLSYLYHIQEDVIADIEGELNLLDELISEAEASYQNLLHAGAGIKYNKALSNGVGLATREQLLEEQQREADTVRTELQSLINARTKRMGSEESVEYLYQKIDGANNWHGGMKADEFQKNAQNSLDVYLTGLQNLVTDIIGNNDELKSELDKLENEKEELLIMKQEALDNNDLGAAKKYDAMIELMDQQIANASKELSDILNNPSATASDKAKAEVQSGSSTALNNINKMKNSALTALSSGSTDIGNFLDALAAMGAEDALNEIKDKAKDSLASEALQTAIDKAIENSHESSMHDIYSDGGVYDGTEEILSAIEDYFGGDIDSLSEENQAIAVYGLDQTGKNGNTAAAELAKAYANRFGEEGNVFFYQKYSKGLETYVSLKAIGNCIGYRYIYNETFSEVSLTTSIAKYSFTINKNKMIYGKTDNTVSGMKEENKILTKNVVLNKIPYLSATDAKEIFNCTSIDVYQSEYGVCMSETQKEKAEKFMEQIQ